MSFATAAIVSSGTATLECVVENTPIVVCYKLSLFSWVLVRLMTNIKFASIVNIIADSAIVPEYLQSKMTANNLATAVTPLLDISYPIRIKMLNRYNDDVQKKLGSPGVYERAAEAIVHRKNKIEKV